MGLRIFYLRAHKYLERYGLGALIKRACQEIRNNILFNRRVLYCRELGDEEADVEVLPDNYKIYRYDNNSAKPERLFKRIAQDYSEELLQGYFQKRFKIGASLWHLRIDTEDIGYIWSTEGRTMNLHHYFPLMSRDVHLYDGYIFAPYRGRRMFFALNNYIYNYYKKKGFHRVFQEVAEWNTASMKSALRNGFVKIGLAKMRCRRGKCKVTWWY